MRDNYWSFLKGVAIIAVVFIHTPYISTNGFASIALRQVVAYPVAFFIFLSGFFVKDDALTWEGVKRLLIPYVIWSILWFTETTLSGSVPVTLWKIVNSIFFGGAFFPLYFLSVLIQLKLFSPLLFRRVNTEGYCLYKDWLWLITPLYLVGLYVWQIHFEKQPAIYAQIFPAWFLFYYAGMYVKRRLSNGMVVVPIYTMILCVACACFLYLSIAEAEWLSEVVQLPFLAASQIKLSSFLYSLALCLLFAALHTKIKDSIICRIGDLSFGIYITHLPVKMVVEGAIGKLPSFFQNGLLSQLLVVFTTVFICYGIIVIASRLLPPKFLLYLGLK